MFIPPFINIVLSVNDIFIQTSFLLLDLIHFELLQNALCSVLGGSLIVHVKDVLRSTWKEAFCQMHENKEDFWMILLFQEILKGNGS